MPLNIKNPEVEALAEELAGMTGESKTEAIRIALRERRQRLRLAHAGRHRGDHRMRFLEAEIWPRIPESQLGSPPTREEREEILGIREEGA
jgi:antitoxin VapB